MYPVSFVSKILVIISASLSHAQDGISMEELKRQYVDLCTQFSMSEFTQNQGPQPIPQVENIRYARHRLTEPTLKKAAENFEVVGLMYDASNAVQFEGLFDKLTQEDKIRLAKKAIEAGFKGDKGKAGNVIKEALPDVFEQLMSDKKSSSLFIQAVELHANLWRDVAKLAEQFSGPEAKDDPIRFQISQSFEGASTTIDAVNVTGRDLHDVTLVIETNVSRQLKGDSRFCYVFIPLLEKNLSFSVLPNNLVSAIPGGRRMPVIRNCLRYSLWCDELSRKDVVMQLPNQKPMPVGPPGQRPIRAIYSLRPLGSLK